MVCIRGFVKLSLGFTRREVSKNCQEDFEKEKYILLKILIKCSLSSGHCSGNGDTPINKNHNLILCQNMAKSVTQQSKKRRKG